MIASSYTAYLAIVMIRPCFRETRQKQIFVQSMPRLWSAIDSRTTLLRAVQQLYSGSFHNSVGGRNGHTFGGYELALFISDIDALPSKEACIDRPGTRTKQSKGGSERCQQYISPAIPWLRENAPQLNKEHNTASDGGPQTSQ